MAKVVETQAPRVDITFHRAWRLQKQEHCYGIIWIASIESYYIVQLSSKKSLEL